MAKLDVNGFHVQGLLPQHASSDTIMRDAVASRIPGIWHQVKLFQHALLMDLQHSHSF